MRAACVAALAVAASLLAATPARADGDPASDVLLAQDAFLPYGAGIPDKVALDLRSAVEHARTRGDELKVAVIASRADLGLVQNLWLKPRKYAPFLGRELRFAYKGLLVIVMPNGFGVYRNGSDVVREQRLLNALPTGRTATELTQAMTRAVERLAGDSGGSSSSTDRLVIAVGAVVLLGFLVFASRYAFRRQSPGRNR